MDRAYHKSKRKHIRSLILTRSRPALGAAPDSIAAERPSEPFAWWDDDCVLQVGNLDLFDKCYLLILDSRFCVIDKDIVGFDVC